MDFAKRYSDEVLEASGRIEAVSIRTRSLKIEGGWYRLTNKTEGAKKIEVIKPGLDVEITYKEFRRPGVHINYIQSIELTPQPDPIAQIADGDIEYELHLVRRKQNDVELRINWYLDHKTSEELLADTEYKRLDKEAWELFHRERELVEKIDRAGAAGLEAWTEAA